MNAENRRNYSSLAIASLVLGILSILGGAVLFIPALLAVIFGHMAVRDCNRDPNLEGKAMAIVGLVLGWFTLVVGTLMLLLFGAVIFAALNVH